MVLNDVIEKHEAESGYSDLQALVRQEEYETISLSHDSVDNVSSAGEIELETGSIVLKQRVGMDFTSLMQINPEIIGWLRAEGTNIDYPIAQTDNNDYYLNHLYNREENGSGTIFADYRNAGDFTDRNIVLYGHHMQNGTMFQALEEYKDQAFYDVNPTMTLFTPTGDYTIELICGTVEDGNYQFVEFAFDDEESFFEYIEGFRARSTFCANVDIQPGDKMVSLCTCSYEWSNARFMIIGRLVPIMEKCE